MSVEVGSYTFTRAFTDYGESLDTISEEIKNDLLQVLTDDIKSRPFNSVQGIGIESLENEANSALSYALYRLQIMLGITNYNSTADADHRIITSQTLIDIERGSDEELSIRLRYFEARNSTGPGGVPTVQELIAKLI